MVLVFEAIRWVFEFSVYGFQFWGGFRASGLVVQDPRVLDVGPKANSLRVHVSKYSHDLTHLYR